MKQDRWLDVDMATAHKQGFNGSDRPLLLLAVITYTISVAPHPTALAAEMSPSVQREFLA